MRLLITGGAGFVGRNLAEYFRERTCLHIADLVKTAEDDEGTSWHYMDVRDEMSIGSVMEEVRPHAVIHAAANKNVRWCQSHPEEAMVINAVGTGHVAAQCRRLGARMIYISTDLVFDCRKGQYREADVPIPETVYGRTKLEGERQAAARTQDLAICRSGGIYGRYSPLLLWLREHIAQGRSVDCYTDIYNTPTYVVNLAEMIQSILECGLLGVYHTVGSERVNRYELFQTFARTFGYDMNLLVPVEAGISMEELLLMPDASLNCLETASRTGVPPDSLVDGMARLLAAGGLE